MVKTLDGILSLVFEDFVEIGLQYFYFEKYQFLNDTFAHINAGFMVVKTFELFVRPIFSLFIPEEEDDWVQMKKEKGKFLIKPFQTIYNYCINITAFICSNN